MTHPPLTTPVAAPASGPTLGSAWRTEDEALLQRLEDELLVEKLFAFLTGAFIGQGSGGAAAKRLHPRAAGLIAELRRRPSGAEIVSAALDADSPAGLGRLVHMLDTLPLADSPPELLHHLALFHARGAAALEQQAPDSAANAWVRSLAAWLALAEERSYLARLEEAVLGPQASRKNKDIGIPPERAPIELLIDVARRADDSARDLAAPGKAALLALARTDEAARIAGASPEMTKRVRIEAQRRRNAAIESALAVIGEGLDEAAARGDSSATGRALLMRAIAVWTWTGNDEAVEHFVVDRIDKIGWELYRARQWESLRYLLDPFRPIFDSLARRIEKDPAQIAFAAVAGQMFVFMAEVESNRPRKIEHAERAVRICPTHRNGRLVLASALCDLAMEIMRTMVVFAKRDDVERVEKLLERVESLYPTTSDLPEAKKMLDRVKKGRITL